MARLLVVRREVPFQLLAWVLMPEHFHLLVVPCLPEHPVDQLLYALKAPLAQRVLRRWRELQPQPGEARLVRNGPPRGPNFQDRTFLAAGESPEDENETHVKSGRV